MNPEGIPEPGTRAIGRQRAQSSFTLWSHILSQNDHHYTSFAYGANTALMLGEWTPELDSLGLNPSSAAYPL